MIADHCKNYDQKCKNVYVFTGKSAELTLVRTDKSKALVAKDDVYLYDSPETH